MAVKSEDLSFQLFIIAYLWSVTWFVTRWVEREGGAQLGIIQGGLKPHEVVQSEVLFSHVCKGFNELRQINVAPSQ